MMKRSPLKRKTELARGGPIQRTAVKAVGKFSEVKARKSLAYRSKKTKEREPEREQVRKEVHERAGFACEYAAVIPEIPCGSPFPDRPRLEVDELRGGSYRSTEMYDPKQCRLTCQIHHDHKTEHKVEVLDRLAKYEEERGDHHD
jgi:hypothetical protein